MRSPNRIALPLLAAAMLITLILVIVIGGSSGGSPSKTSTTAPSTGFEGAALPPGIRAPDFTLTNQAGHQVSLADLRGQVAVLTFLYTDCGAACIVIAEQIRGALDELGHPVPVLVVSADPTGDTPANVRRFLSQVSLSGRARYLTGTPTQLRSIWHAYKVVPGSAGRQAFGRYASVLLIDGRGDERVLFQSEQLTPEALSHDIRLLQKSL